MDTALDAVASLELCFGLSSVQLVLFWCAAGVATVAYFAANAYRERLKAPKNKVSKTFHGGATEVAESSGLEAGLLNGCAQAGVQVPCQLMAEVCAKLGTARGLEAASLAVLLAMKRRRTFSSLSTAVLPKQGAACEVDIELTLPGMTFAELLAVTDSALQSLAPSATATFENPELIFAWDQSAAPDDLRPGQWMMKLDSNNGLVVMGSSPDEERSFQILFEACSAGPDLSVWEMPTISESCSQAVLSWGKSAKDFASYRDSSSTRLLPVPQLLLRNCTDPQADAVAGDGFRISYEELYKRAGIVQSAVMSAATPNRSKSAILFMPRGEAIASAFLGVLRAGFQVVPVDVHWPGDRAISVVEISEASVVLVDASSAAAWAALGVMNLPVVCVDPLLLQQGQEPLPDPLVLDQDDPAIVLFTSGSTGKPKGIVLSHGYVTSLAAGVGEWKRMTPKTRTLCYHSPTWMPFIDYLFAPLLKGGCCLYFPDGGSHVVKPTELKAFAIKHEATSAGFVPAMLDILLDEGLPPSLTDIGVGGAAVPADVCLRTIDALPDNGLLYTGYSGTEQGDVTAIKMSTVADVHQYTNKQSFMTAGRPHSGQTFAILDEGFSPVGPDAVGEVCVAGPGLASEYLGLPEKTEETFLKSVRALGGLRAARSGDLAAWKNGSLQVVGRRDSMVKVRGARVELGEVETAVLSHPAVKTAVVTVFEDQLVAYVVPAVPADLRQHCKERLVAYMVPHRWEGLDELPRLPNGKINKKALPKPEVRADGAETVMELDSLGQMRKFTRRAAAEDFVLDNVRAILIGIVLHSHAIPLNPTGAGMLSHDNQDLHASWGPVQLFIFQLLRGGGWSSLAFLSGFDDTRSMRPYGMTYREPLFLILWVALDFNWLLWYLPAFVIMRACFCAAHSLGLEKTHILLASQVWLIMPAFVDLYIGWTSDDTSGVIPTECPSGCLCPWQQWPWSKALAPYILGWWVEPSAPDANSFLGHALIFIPCYWTGFYAGGSIFKYLTKIAEEANILKRVATASAVFGVYYAMFTWGQPLQADYKDSCSAFWVSGGFVWMQVIKNVVYFMTNLSMSLLYVMFIAAAVPVHLKYLAKVCFSALIFSGFTACIMDVPSMALVLRGVLPSSVSPGIEVVWTLGVCFLYELLVGAFFAWLLPKIAKLVMGVAAIVKK